MHLYPIHRVHSSAPEGRRYAYTYDPNGNRASLTQPNGVTTTSTYNARNRLTTLTSQHGPTTQVVQQYDLTLGPAGNRTRISEQGGTVRDYTYDTLLRLTGEQVTRNGTLADATTYTYDPASNRTTQVTTGANAETVNYTYDERDRLLTEDTTAYTWDANGNLVSRAGDATYVWDFENRLTRVELAGGESVAYVYDVDENRVQTTVTPGTGAPVVTNYLVDSADALSQVVAESDGAGVLGAYYVRGDGELLAVLRTAHTRFYHTDATGSIRALTDETGTVTDTYTYSAFGELLSHVGSDPQPYAFAGEPRDPNSGLAYHRARWLDPQLGRFVSADPFAGNTSDPVSLHKYLYANADPANKRDPSGYTTLAELSNTMKSMASLSHRVIQILNRIDQAQGIVDAVNAVQGAVNLMTNGNIVQYIDEAMTVVKTNANIKFIFSPAQAAQSLRMNYRKIITTATGEWATWLVTHHKYVTGLLLWMPNPGLLDGLPHIPTGLKLGRLPVSLVFGGKNKWGSVFGVGFLAPGGAGVDQKRQVWRMDFNQGHTTPNAKEIDVWADSPFHYHVMKP